ncbi:MAG: MBL fold metallo-hydrolase [Rhizobacter sp.]|nr:MBL fold metallo-hydrolase [Ferruginibacter sp.]
MYLLLILLMIVLTVMLSIQQAQFGRYPSGERLQRIKRSVHYKEGAFQNESFTPQLTEGASYFGVLNEFLFKKNERKRPLEALPSIKTDLHHLPLNENILVWFGHSSYYMQVDGKRILVDPVLSGSASPLPGGTKAFVGADIFKPSDIPAIDILFISHDHWDHLDYRTIKELKPKIKNVICGLGVGEHFEYWGYDKKIIHEKDWNESVDLPDGFKVTLTPARHFSGRSFKRNPSLWTSFVLQTPAHKIFIGGDSGYDTHFAEIGNQHGPFDLAILENGQYDKSWRYIHLLPEEFLVAAGELKAKKILPVHSAKFSLGNHPWDEPLIKVIQNNLTAHLNIITPMIGEPVYINDATQQFSNWWEGVK